MITLPDRIYDALAARLEIRLRDLAEERGPLPVNEAGQRLVMAELREVIERDLAELSWTHRGEEATG